MPAIASLISLDTGVTNLTLANTLRTALEFAGYNTVDFFTAANSDRVLISRFNFNPNTYGTIFLENRVTTTRGIYQRLITNWDSVNRVPPTTAIATPNNTTVTFGTAKTLFTVVNHPEFRMVMVEQGTSYQFAGYARPATKPAWWDENTYPYVFAPTNNALTAFNGFPANPYGTTGAYPLLYITQMSQTTPITNKPDVLEGAGILLPPIASPKGYVGVFSSDIGICSATGLRRGDMIENFLLLSIGISALGIKSNAPS
jgi:hypothetical protein